MRRTPLISQRLMGPLGNAEPGLRGRGLGAQGPAELGELRLGRDVGRGGEILGEAILDRGPGQLGPADAGRRRPRRGGLNRRRRQHDELGVRHVDVERVHRRAPVVHIVKRPHRGRDHEGGLQEALTVHAGRGQPRFVVRRPHRFGVLIAGAVPDCDPPAHACVSFRPHWGGGDPAKSRLGHLLADRRHGPLQSEQPVRQSLEELGGGKELQVGARPADRPVGRFVQPGAPGRRVQPGQRPLPGPERVEDRTGEEPVHQQEFHDPGFVDALLVGTQVSIVGGTGPKGGGPALVRALGADPCREHARGHVHPFQTAAQDQRIITRVPAHARLDVASDVRRALADVREERRRTEVAGGGHPGLQRVVGGIQAFPDIRGESLPGAAGVLPGGGQRADDRA